MVIRDWCGESHHRLIHSVGVNTAYTPEPGIANCIFISAKLSMQTVVLYVEKKCLARITLRLILFQVDVKSFCDFISV